MNQILIIIGGATSFIWGVSHLFPTKNVIKGFGSIPEDNKNIIAMEWINEGATLIFLGLLTIVLTLIDPKSDTSILVYWFIIGMLLALAIISLFTGFKVNFLPYRLCPFIFSFSALCIYRDGLIGSNSFESKKHENSA